METDETLKLLFNKFPEKVVFSMANLNVCYRLAKTLKMADLEKKLFKFQVFISAFNRSIQEAGEIKILFEIEDLVFQLNKENIEQTVQKAIELLSKAKNYDSENKNENNLYRYLTMKTFARCIFGFCIYKVDLIDLAISFVAKIDKVVPHFFDVFKNIVFSETKNPILLPKSDEVPNDQIPSSSLMTLYFHKELEYLQKRMKIKMKDTSNCNNNGTGKVKNFASDLFEVIKNDDWEAFQLFSLNPQFNGLTLILPKRYQITSKMEGFSDFTEGLTMINVAAMFSSINIFKYLLKQRNADLFSLNAELVVYGGNPQIVHNVEECDKHIFDQNDEEILMSSIKGHHSEIFEWLLDSKNLALTHKSSKLNFFDVQFPNVLFNLSFNSKSFVTICYLLGSYKILYHLMVKGFNLLQIWEESVYFDNELIFNLFDRMKEFEYMNIDRIIYKAIKYGHSNILLSLLEKENNLKTEDKELGNINESAFDLTSEEAELIKYMDKRMNSFHTATKNEHFDVLKIMLDSNLFNVNQELDGLKPIHLAVESQNSKIVELLLFHQNSTEIIDLNFIAGPDTSTKVKGKTSLHIAVLNNDIEIVKLLIGHPKCNLNVHDQTNGNTPIHYACQNNQKEIVEIMLKNPRIDIRLTNNSWHKPCDVAVGFDIKALLQSK